MSKKVNMKQRVLVVGRSFANLQKYLDNHGYEYVVLRDQLFPLKNPKQQPANLVFADFSSRESVLEALSKIPGTFDGVVTVYENYILPAAWITEHLGLPGLPVRAAAACTDKQLMRQAFAKAPEPISPDFAEVDSRKDLVDFAKQHHFPLILKPANLAKSLLVTKSENLDELLANYDETIHALATVYRKYAPHRQPKLLVEEFLVGTIHSVDAFIDKTGEPQVLEQVVDYQTGYDIGHTDSFHYSRILPSKLSKADQTALRHVATLGCQALGMKNSPAHVEIIMTPTGPRIVEIGARNGGYRERMHGLANGIDISGAALAVACGQPANVTSTRNDPCAVLELFPKESGLFLGLTNASELARLQSLVYLSIKPSEGDKVGRAADGHKMCAVIILHNSDAEQFNRDLDYINHNVHVKLA